MILSTWLSLKVVYEMSLSQALALDESGNLFLIRPDNIGYK
jgi:hypothetical protein